MRETNEIVITNYKDKKIDREIDLNILGRHFDGSYITKYEIVNDGGREKFIVEFSPERIIKEYKKAD